jgi:hypothetical protein
MISRTQFGLGIKVLDDPACNTGGFFFGEISGSFNLPE